MDELDEEKPKVIFTLGDEEFENVEVSTEFYSEEDMELLKSPGVFGTGEINFEIQQWKPKIEYTEEFINWLVNERPFMIKKWKPSDGYIRLP